MGNPSFTDDFPSYQAPFGAGDFRGFSIALLDSNRVSLFQSLQSPMARRRNGHDRGARRGVGVKAVLVCGMPMISASQWTEVELWSCRKVEKLISSHGV